MMVAVCGPNEATLEEAELAEAVGEALARRGCAVICGGRDGVMAAACRGAKRAGGVTIGVLPGYDRRAANPWVDYAICTGMGEARNAIVVASADVVIAWVAGSVHYRRSRSRSSSASASSHWEAGHSRTSDWPARKPNNSTARR